MEKCGACAAIETSKRGAPGHDQLEETSRDRKSYPQGGIGYRRFTCRTCGTKWEYENDKNDQWAGWSVVD